MPREPFKDLGYFTVRNGPFPAVCGGDPMPDNPRSANEERPTVPHIDRYNAMFVDKSGLSMWMMDPGRGKVF
jgi:hypothetical protein